LLLHECPDIISCGTAEINLYVLSASHPNSYDHKGDGIKKFFLPLLMTLFLLSGCARPPFGGDSTSEVGNGTAWTSQSGYLVTNYHVVNPLMADSDSVKANEIYISYKGHTQKAEVVEFDVFADLCLLKVEDNSKIPPALSGASNFARMGQQVHTIGFPLVAAFGLAPKYLDGCVSSLLRYKNGLYTQNFAPGKNTVRLESGFYQNEGWLQGLIMTTIPAIEGCSGAPLLDEEGNVMGVIATAVNSPELIKHGDNVLHSSFAIPMIYLNVLEEKTVTKHGSRDNLSRSWVAPEDAVDLVMTITPSTPDDVKAQCWELLSLITKGFEPPAAR